jgi:hypothetical protein
MNGIIPTIEKVGDVSLLLVPVKDKVQYAILW